MEDNYHEKGAVWHIDSGNTAGFYGLRWPVRIALSDKPRETAPQVAASGLAGLVNENSTFAFDLYRSLSVKDDNLFYRLHRELRVSGRGNCPMMAAN